MTVLLVNDDGWQSDGLQSARDALLANNIPVLAVAPAVPRSGSARSATFRQPVRVERVQGDDDNPVYACTGTPVDCVRVALLSHLASGVELVVSGINEGANLGDDATYSSTTGAAIEGALLGLPSFSISQQSTDSKFRLVDRAGYEWTESVDLTVRLIRHVLTSPPPPRSIVNVNCPGRPTGKPALVTVLGQRAWRRGALVEERTAEHGEGYYTFGVNDDAEPPFKAADGTDFAALAAGHASITPLTFAWGTSGALTASRRWAQEAAAVVNAGVRSETSDSAAPRAAASPTQGLG